MARHTAHVGLRSTFVSRLDDAVPGALDEPGIDDGGRPEDPVPGMLELMEPVLGPTETDDELGVGMPYGGGENDGMGELVGALLEPVPG